MKLTVKTHILALLLIVFYAITCTAQLKKQTYSDAYNLHFNMQSDSMVMCQWRENGAYSNYSIPIYMKDSTDYLFAKKFFKGFPFYNRLRTEYEQRILLPEGNLKDAVVEFESKGENIQQVYIILDAIGNEENILFSDTMKFVPETILSIVSQSIALKDAKLLNIRINAQGKIDSDAYIAFSKLNIIIDGKQIDKFVVQKLPPLIANNLYGYTAINMNEAITSEVMDEFDKYKIIGLGESIHGNSAVKDMAYRLILEAVERLNCKLILLEMHLEKSLDYNRFIQDVNYTFDGFSALDKITTVFLKKLQSFNADKSDKSKVRLYGISYNTNQTSSQSSAVDIFDFVTKLNQDIRIPEVDQFALLLAEEKLDLAIDFLDNHRDKIEKLLTFEEIECILKILKISEEMGKDRIERFVRRDSAMFLNANFLIDRFANADKTKAIIYTHAAHINPISTFPAVPCSPLGYYMRETYADNYSSFLLLIGRGKSVAYDMEFNVKDSIMKDNPKNSIENSLSLMEDTVFYLPLTVDFNTLILSRFKGSHHIPQEFYPFNLYQRYKGLFFIKDSKWESSDNKEISFDKASDMFMKKMKQRQKKIEEIQKRVKNISQH